MGRIESQGVADAITEGVNKSLHGSQASCGDLIEGFAVSLASLSVFLNDAMKGDDAGAILHIITTTAEQLLKEGEDSDKGEKEDTDSDA